MHLRTLYELGLRYLGLNWNYRNQLADGVGEQSNTGLTKFGQEVVADANQLGILLDVSHITEKGFWDVLETTKAPVMASHANTKALCNVPRNLTDDQIKALADNKGVIGIVLNGRFIDPDIENTKRPTLQILLNHIDYMVNLVGVDHVGIGADFMDFVLDYVEPIVQGIPSVPVDEWTQSMVESTRWFANKNVIKYPKGLENIAQLPNLTRGLIKRGYSDSEIEKILGGNFIRLFKTVIGK